MMMPSWSQYLLHQERITKAEKQTIDRAIALHLGRNPPEVRTYIRVNKTFRETTGTGEPPGQRLDQKNHTISAAQRDRLARSLWWASDALLCNGPLATLRVAIRVSSLTVDPATKSRKSEISYRMLVLRNF